MLKHNPAYQCTCIYLLLMCRLQVAWTPKLAMHCSDFAQNWSDGYLTAAADILLSTLLSVVCGKKWVSLVQQTGLKKVWSMYGQLQYLLLFVRQLWISSEAWGFPNVNHWMGVIASICWLQQTALMASVAQDEMTCLPLHVRIWRHPECRSVNRCCKDLGSFYYI